MARVGSRYYKAPELLVGFRFYDYAVDIFSYVMVRSGPKLLCPTGLSVFVVQYALSQPSASFPVADDP